MVLSYVSTVLSTMYWAFVGRLLVHRSTVLSFLWKFVENFKFYGEVTSGP